MEKERQISLLEIFWVMLKIGAFTIGGGYAMILMIQKEVTKRDWIREEDFPDLIALSQAAPGLLAVNISIFAGYKLRGVKGSVAATVGSCLAPFLTILAIALFFTNYANEPAVRKVFAGMRPAVVALIAVPMVKMVKSTCRRWWQFALTAAAMGLVAFLQVSPIYILMVVIVLAISISYYCNRR